MKKIVIKDSFAFIYLNKEFYNPVSIKISLNQYSEFVNSSISELGKYYVIKLDLMDYSFTFKEIANEITNYIMSEEYNKTNNLK